MSEESEAIDNLSSNLTVLFGASTLQLTGIKSNIRDVKSTIDNIVTWIEKVVNELENIDKELSGVNINLINANVILDEISKTDTEIETEFYGTPKTITTRIRSQNIVDGS